MKKLAYPLGMLLLAGLLVSCSLGTPKTYTISGEYVVIENNQPVVADGDEASAIESQQRLDPSSVTVAVTYQTTNKAGDTESVELHSGSLADGNLMFSGSIEEPTVVEISAMLGEDDPLKATTVLTPGDAIKFALLDYQGVYPSDQLVLVGSSRSSEDPEKAFSLVGDFTALEKNLTHGVASIQGVTFDEDGERTFVYLGVVMLEGNEFLVEADIEEPTVVYVTVSDAETDYFSSTRDVVVEPGVEIVVRPRGTARQLLATSGSGLHASIVESWQQSDEYLSTLDENSAAYERWSDALDAQANETEAAETESDENSGETNTDDEEASGSSEEPSDLDAESKSSEANDSDEASDENAEETVAVASAETSTPPAEGCEHVAIENKPARPRSAVNMDNQPEFYRTYYETRDKLDSIRTEALQNIAVNSEIPLESLIALEIGAFSALGVENRSDALPVYDRIASELDAETVASRVNPARDRLVRYIELEYNDSNLQPGQKAPEFTLANLEGTESALYDILGERELVLIDFWASWCGPCIADFPELKKLYGAYKEHGFEIVGVSIDSAFEDWEEGSTEHKLPWIDLGEMDGWDGATAVSYGVSAIPKGYLLDSEGCILKKNLRPASLREALIARFGEMPEPDDASTSTDSDSAKSNNEEISG
ncbi:MAG: redoxin domain-containing protein [Gammaproteobacteria bacterium]|nr:redoxin domain-containing protein [Gammaproteobacteria bacterium]